MQGRLHHPHTATPIADVILPKRGKKRGSYTCGRCGVPKKGHVCSFPKDLNPISNPNPNLTPSPSSNPSPDPESFRLPSPLSVVRPQSPPPPPPPQQRLILPQLRRALSFDDIDVTDSCKSDDEEDEFFLDPDNESDVIGSGKLPGYCLWEVFKRLPPPALLAAARVCKGWRDTSRKVWKSAEELRLRVPVKAQIGLVGSVLKKCPGLVKLSVTMERLVLSKNGTAGRI